MIPTIAQLHQFLIAHYSLDEFKSLCVVLAVEYDDLGGEGRAGKARELALYMQRHSRLVDLQAVLAQQHEAAYRLVFGEAAIRPVVNAVPPRRQRRRFERNPRQIFVSHATADAAFAHRLADDLRREGYTIWIAPESIPDGQWVSAINRGLAESGAMLLVLTPAALESPWVEMETNVAIELERAGEMRFIPVCLEQDRYDPIWHAYQWVMFYSDYDAAWRELLIRLGASLAKANKAPAAQKPTSTKTPPTTERKISGKQAKEIQALAHEIAAELGRHSGADELREVYRRFNRHFGLGGYRQLPRRRFEEGMAFLTGWRDEVEASAEAKTPLPSPLPEEEVVGSLVTLHPRPLGSTPDRTSPSSFVARILTTLYPHPSGSVSDRRIHEKTGIELIRIPAGPFLYSSSNADKMADQDEELQRTIDLPEYWIGRYPVTNAQYKRFVVATGHKPPSHWNRSKPPRDKIDHPVVSVTWADVKSFCDWAGLTQPTQEQWEKAARGTDGRIWPWGNEPPTEKHCNFNKNVGDTTPVGHYSPLGDSPYGCADMAGNCEEWTSSVAGEVRFLRSGSWWSDAKGCRCAMRYRKGPYGSFHGFGFRALIAPS